ncbi:alpha/beta hydrolase [Alicyclobacillus ferrooxydans]|uniref:alpha/beta hydrolase n=1 Tax=Alicyclobacillus ferrooxydans TaxID=471514 RepID=UPI000A6C332F|nr:alpha/beta hydrolase [Alicyclobacillus ferrooxydans]
MDNKVHPDLQPMFAQIPVIDFTDLETIRSPSILPPAERVAGVVISDREIPGPDGAPTVWIRVYEPVGKEADIPAVLWIHGGGYILGTHEQDDGLCQRFVDEGKCLVASVNYRLAPEHPFPAAIEDCYAALKWLADSAEELGVDRNRIAIAGASAGGGLTAALALLARDRGGPSICFQMPLYPMLDDRNVTPSSHEIRDERVWNRQTNIAAWQMYLTGSVSGDGRGSMDGSAGDAADAGGGAGASSSTDVGARGALVTGRLDVGSDTGSAAVSPYAAPTRAEDLSGLPPCYTCVGGADVFRDETIEYVTRLQQAGVPVEFHIYPGGFHGFELFVPDAPISQRAVNEYVGALVRGLQPVNANLRWTPSP